MRILSFTSMVVLALLQSAPQNPANNGTVEGIVRNAATHEPMEGVDVALKRDDEAAVAAMLHAVRTDNKGKFFLKDIAPGHYSLLRRRLGYLSPNGDPWWEAEIQISRQQHVTGLVLELIPGASISGRIFAADGEPVVGTRVYAAEPSYVDGVHKLDHGQSTTTDDQGRYRLFWLLPGEYFLQADYSPNQPGLESTIVSFPGTFDQNSAKPVVVPADTELTGMDIVFPTPSIAPTFKVTGVITGGPAAADNKLIPTVRLVSRGGRDNAVRARANGQFQLRGVPAGMYDLYAWVEDGGRNLFTSKSSINVESNVENLQVTMQRGVDVRVRITVNGVAPAGVFGDTDPELDPLTGILPSYYSGLFSILDGYKADKNSGEYLLPQVPPGRYRLKYPADVLKNGYIADIQQDRRSVFDEGFVVGNTAPDPLQIAIVTSGGVVEGDVRDLQGNAVPPATVVLVPLLEHRNNPVLFHRYTSDRSGHFSMQNVAPGAYKIFAWASLPFGEPWLNAEFMSQYETHGQSVQVEANKTVSVQVTVIAKAGP